MMNKSKSPDGGPSSQETASRVVGGGGSTHARGNGAAARGPLHYEITKDRPDGMPLPVGMAPEAHGGHYYTPEDRAKYEPIIGYDKGLAPGYDPVREMTGGDDERGKYEMKPWKSPAGEDGTCLVKMNRDGSRSIVAILAIDPQGNSVQLPPNTVGLKAGWKFAADGDLKEKAKQADEFAKRDEERRQASLKVAPPAPAAPPAPTETPEARKAREEADPVAQALRHGHSKSTAEKADEAAKDKK